MEFYNSMSALEKVYLFCAVLGGVFFIIQMVLNFLLGNSGGDSADIEVDGDTGGDSSSSTDASFTVLTVQGLTAFFLFGGLAGLAASSQGGVGGALSSLIAVVVGVAGMFGSAWLVRALLGLQSTGTLDIKNTIGCQGTVYLTVRSVAGGQIQLEVQEKLRSFDAVCAEGEEIPTGTLVRVLRHVGAETLVVERIK